MNTTIEALVSLYFCVTLTLFAGFVLAESACQHKHDVADCKVILVPTGETQ